MQAKKDMGNHEVIVLVHGLMRSYKSMRPLGLYLQKKGYQIHFYSYPSTKYVIKEHGDQFKNFLEALLLKNPNAKLHVITHSLGGIIARAALSELSEKLLASCHCLIMLAPPNQGSFLAKLCLKIVPPISRYIKPLAELSTDCEAYVHTVAVPEKIKIAIIAGRFDLKAPPNITHLPNAKDFILINSSHTFIMNHPKTRKTIMQILQE